MKATVLSVTGWEEAFTSLFISKRTWTPELGEDIRRVVNICTDTRGRYTFSKISPAKHYIEADRRFREWSEKLLKWGPKHITLLRFLDIAIMTEGMHRAGQDDKR